MLRRPLAFISLAVLLGCSIPEEGATPAEDGSAAKALPASADNIEDEGDFKVAYGEIQNPDYEELRQIFQETRLLEDTARDLNEVFLLPSDVTLALRECGEPNAYYEPDEQRISLCYELVEYFAQLFAPEDETPEAEEDAGTSIAGATLFVFFHELGHALIDLYDLPITGREEDAVDQLATLILLEGGEEGERAALDGASSFLPAEEEQELEELSFWDEHSLGEQRFYNILCWSYGKNPEGLQDLIDDETLPAERAERCPGEYERMSNAWDTLLGSYMKG